MNQKRLAAVLRIRTLQERSARGELARTRRDHQYAVAVERRTWELIDELAAPVARGLNAHHLAGRHAQVTAGLLSTQPLRAETERTHESMEVAKADWTVAARRVEALDRLAERIAEAEKAESARLAGNEIDDLVLARRGREADIAGDAA
jgi:flagellar export protein FliJ